MHRILVIRFSSLGDVVLLSSLLDALRILHPSARIHLVTKRLYAPLYLEDPRVDTLHAIESGRGVLDLLPELEEKEFDLILDAHGSLRSQLLTFLLPPAPTRRIGKDTIARILLSRGRVRTRALQRRQIDRYLALLEDPIAPQQPRLLLGAGAWARADVLLPSAPTLVLAPGARHAPKRWPSDHYAELARRFQERFEAPLILVGGAEERDVCEEIRSSLPGPTQVFAGELPLDILAAVLGRCRLTVCNDSGLLHVSEAVGTPVLAFFGPTTRDWGYFPVHPSSEILEHEVSCRPCSRRGDRPCRMPEQWCLSRTSVDLAFARLERAWLRLAESSPAEAMPTPAARVDPRI